MFCVGVCVLSGLVCVLVGVCELLFVFRCLSSGYCLCRCLCL